MPNPYNGKIAVVYYNLTDVQDNYFCQHCITMNSTSLYCPFGSHYVIPICHLCKCQLHSNYTACQEYNKPQ